MDYCDVAIVGGGPAGSSCAWALRHSGLDVLIIDRANFPRDKVCAGWITPPVIELLDIDTAGYARDRTFQPITSFQISCMEEEPLSISFDEPVSYGIRRCEFDTFLLRRCGARVREGVQVKRIERQQDSWVINDEIRTRMLVGAGGHFCPVAKYVSQKDGAAGLVVAQESEFELDATHAPTCAAGTVELLFCRDLEGYAWIFRKENYLNVGLGRVDSRNLPKHFAQFWDRYRQAAGIPALPAKSVHGHAYLLYGNSRRAVAGDGILLIGDAAGLAAPHSGEGIRPAIESGILAARTILDARPDYRSKRLSSYENSITSTFNGASGSVSKLAEYLPRKLRTALGRRLLRNRRFCRDVVINDWFCGRNRPSDYGRIVAL